MFKLLGFIYCYWFTIFSIPLNNNDFLSIPIISHKKAFYRTKQSINPQVIVIRNHEIDTFAELVLNDTKHSYASWMGKDGYYIIYIPENTPEATITIQTLDSEHQKSNISLTELKIDDIDHDILKAFESHSIATELRYQQYTGGADQRILAQSKFEFSKKLFEKSNYPFFASLSSFELAIIYFELNQFNESIIHLSFSIDNWDNKAYSTQKFKSINVKGLTFWKLHELDKAIVEFNKLINRYSKDNNFPLLSESLNNLGLIYWEQGNYTKSKLMYIKALKYLSVNFGTVDNLNIDINNIKNLKAVSATINNLALVNDSLGNTKQAIQLWESYIELSKSLSDSNILAQAKNNISLLYLQKGKFDEAKLLLNEAIITFKNNNNNRWLSLASHNLGQVYFTLGLYRLAEIRFNSALLLRDEINNPKGLSESKIKLMELYRKQFKYAKSNKLGIEVLNLSKKINYQKGIALSYLNDFHYNKFNKKYNEAENDLNNAIKIAENKTYKRILSKLQVNKAKLLILQNRYSSAINILKFETENLKNIWDTKLLNKVNNLLAQAYIKNNELDKAESTINNEIDNMRFYMNSTKSDKIRSDLSRMLKETLGIYNTITALQHKPELGFIKTNQMLAEYRALKKKDKTLQSSLSEASVDDLLAMINNKTLALENNKLSDEGKKHIQNDIVELKAELDFSFTAAINNNTDEFDLKEIQTKLDDNSLVIQFSISDAGGVAWWISQDKFQSFILEDKESIAKLVTKARATFMQENNNYQAISDLSNKLFTPLKSFNGIKNIYLILDEPLNLIPFNALQDPRFNSNISIAENTSIQRISSIKSVFKLDRKHGKYKSIIIADPITSQTDVRLSHIDITDSNTISFNRLLGTKSEALSISKIIDAKILQGFDANKSRFMNLNFSNFNIIHFATHAFFHQDISGLSSLVLSNFNNKGEQQTSFLRGLEISNLNLNGKLIVLSGCETGVGNNDNSLGLDGLTQSFMQAGAKNLIASLWKVDDRITEKMMVEFYKNYSQGMSIANALRQAQSKIRDNPRTRHPKNWAGWFLLSN